MARVPDPPHPYVSRGGVKLAAALASFHLDVHGFVCADLGCSTGGFVDCLLQHGAARVFAVDTGYGQLAWKLRQDDRVTVLERTNALHVQPPGDGRASCDLVTIDLGWTRQSRALPATLPWLKPHSGRVVTLIKPHYESGEHRLAEQETRGVAERTLAEAEAAGWQSHGLIESPIRGSKGGNVELLALLSRKA
jgi:23S rRNA (cytidine1920-2'-O)/16S rRNA (cytidine1409-2'-O)-methyltransferase